MILIGFEYYSPNEDDIDSEEAEANDDCSVEILVADGEPSFENFLRCWAIEFNEPQNALKPLMLQMNSCFGA